MLNSEYTIGSLDKNLNLEGSSGNAWAVDTLSSANVTHSGAVYGGSNCIHEMVKEVLPEGRRANKRNT